MSEFKREERYIVLKISDLERTPLSNLERNALKNICKYVAEFRSEAGKPEFECVVIESDWPEYEPAWKAIEQRMNAIDAAMKEPK